MVARPVDGPGHYLSEGFRLADPPTQLKIHGRITGLPVELNARQTLVISDFGYAPSQGRVVSQGTAQALSGNDEVRSAYFG